MQNIIKLSAAVHELSWSEGKKTPTKTIHSVATMWTVKTENVTTRCNFRARNAQKRVCDTGEAQCSTEPQAGLSENRFVADGCS